VCNDFGNNVPYSAYLEAFSQIRAPMVFRFGLHGPLVAGGLKLSAPPSKIRIYGLRHCPLYGTRTFC